MPKGTLSVAMVNYNDASYIGEAIEAILTQSFKAKELIIVDDGSTDNSVEIVNRYVRQDSRVCLLRNDRNLGINFSGNRAMQAVSGDYVYAASANDRILPGFFEKSMRLLKEYPQAGLCCAESVALFPDLTLGNPRAFTSKPCYFSPRELVLRMRSKDRFYLPLALGTVWKRSSLLHAGGWRSELEVFSDWFAAHVIAFREGISYIPEPLVMNRINPGSFSNTYGSLPILQRKVERFGRLMLRWPEYRDVSKLFQQSGAIQTFLGMSHRTQFLTLLFHPEYWRNTFPLFFKRVWWKIFM